MSAGECHLCGTVWTGDDNTDCAAHCDAVRRLSAQLAKVTAERDAGREGLICAGCMGLEPPEGKDPRTLNPTEYCNPNFCDLARWHEKTIAAPPCGSPASGSRCRFMPPRSC
jgi:hypothetical protein